MRKNKFKTIQKLLKVRGFNKGQVTRLLKKSGVKISLLKEVSTTKDGREFLKDILKATQTMDKDNYKMYVENHPYVLDLTEAKK